MGKRKRDGNCEEGGQKKQKLVTSFIRLLIFLCELGEMIQNNKEDEANLEHYEYKVKLYEEHAEKLVEKGWRHPSFIRTMKKTPHHLQLDSSIVHLQNLIPERIKEITNKVKKFEDMLPEVISECIPQIRDKSLVVGCYGGYGFVHELLFVRESPPLFPFILDLAATSSQKALINLRKTCKFFALKVFDAWVTRASEAACTHLSA